MSATNLGRQFDGYNLRYHTDDEGGHSISAYHDDKPVGGLIWDAGSGVIHDVSVDAEHRRKGVATAMYKMAKSIAPIKHSKNLSKEGKSWKRSLK